MIWGAWLIGLIACAPPPVDAREVAFRESFARYRSFVAYVAVPRDPSLGLLPLPDEHIILRGDHRGRFVFEGAGRSGRTVWDGEHLTVHGRDDEPPRPYGATTDEILKVAVAEARAGFPGTRFLDPDLPADLNVWDLARIPRGLTWRLDLPGPHDDPYGIYVKAAASGAPEVVAVIRLVSHGRDGWPRVLDSTTFYGWQWDVPVEDDFARREQWSWQELRFDLQRRVELAPPEPDRSRPREVTPVSEPSSARRLPYHLRYDRVIPVFRPELSEGGPTPAPCPQPEAPYAAWEGVCEPGAVHTVPLRWVWRPDLHGSDWQGVEAAVAGRCPIRLHLGARQEARISAGTRVRAQVALRVRSLADGPVADVPVDTESAGPRDGVGDIRFRVPLDGLDPATLEILLEGQLTVTCGLRPESGIQRYALAAHDDASTPILRWNGCMPAPTPRTGAMDLLPRRW